MTALLPEQPRAGAWRDLLALAAILLVSFGVRVAAKSLSGTGPVESEGSAYARIAENVPNHHKTRWRRSYFSFWATFSCAFLAVLGLTACLETIGSRQAYAHPGKMGWSKGIYSASTNSVGGAFTDDAQGSERADVVAQATTSQPPGMTSTITKDGITWIFDRPVSAGEFVTGDYYVIGPVTVIAVDPAPTASPPYENGSVLNLPTANGKSGFDSRLDDGSDQSSWFDPSFRVYPPFTLKAGDALVSSISLTETHSRPELMRASTMSASPVRTVSILTVLAERPSADAFRPSYCDRRQAIYRADSLRRNLLPSLPPPNPSETPKLAQFEAWYRRPWIDTNTFLFDAPAEYMPSYGQHIAFTDSYAALLLALNFPARQKVALTNYFVQYGIDLYGCLSAGVGWPAFGGHHSGRKLPIVLAGILLNNDAMKNVSAKYANVFGEDMQTVYVTQIPPAGRYQQAWQGAKAIYGGHYGVKASGEPVSPGLYGPYEQLQPSSWPTIDGGQLGESYRRCCTSVSWVGEALVLHLLHAETVWNHPAFFDYVDRWMTEDDTQAIALIKQQSGFDYTPEWDRQKQTRYWLHGQISEPSFIDDMWKKYR
jgi:hypothetical protein